VVGREQTLGIERRANPARVEGLQFFINECQNGFPELNCCPEESVREGAHGYSISKASQSACTELGCATRRSFLQRKVAIMISRHWNAVTLPSQIVPQREGASSSSTKRTMSRRSVCRFENLRERTISR